MYYFSLNKPETVLFKIRNKIKKNKPCDIRYRGSHKESDQENYQESRLDQMAKEKELKDWVRRSLVTITNSRKQQIKEYVAALGPPLKNIFIIKIIKFITCALEGKKLGSNTEVKPKRKK